MEFSPEYGPPKRPVIVIVDNFEEIEEAVGKDMNLVRGFANLARRQGVNGLHFILSGQPDAIRGRDEWSKRAKDSRYGIALDPDNVSTLGGKLPRSQQADEYPLGRGFVIKAGQTQLVQVASPYTDADDAFTELEPEEALDKWVTLIQERWAGQAATWNHPEPQLDAKKEERAATASTAGDLSEEQLERIYADMPSIAPGTNGDQEPGLSPAQLSELQRMIQRAYGVSKTKALGEDWMQNHIVPDHIDGLRKKIAETLGDDWASRVEQRFREPAQAVDTFGAEMAVALGFSAVEPQES
jgi:hypothetical protein